MWRVGKTNNDSTAMVVDAQDTCMFIVDDVVTAKRVVDAHNQALMDHHHRVTESFADTGKRPDGEASVLVIVVEFPLPITPIAAICKQLDLISPGVTISPITERTRRVVELYAGDSIIDCRSSDG